MFGFFKRREEIFNKLIEDQASITFEGLRLLVKYLESADIRQVLQYAAWLAEENIYDLNAVTA